LPIADAAEPNLQAKSLSILNDVVGLKTDQYIVTEGVQRENQILDSPQKVVNFNLVSAGSSVRVTCSYVKDMLNLVYLSDLDGNLKLTQPVVNTVEAAKNLLLSYQRETGDVTYGKFASMLNDIDAGKNATMVVGNVKFEGSTQQNTTSYMWTYVDGNGVLAERKNICLNYECGTLKSFYNNWPFYTIADTTSKLSAGEATELAIEASKNFSYIVTDANGTEQTVSGFSIDPESLGNAKLIYVNSVEKEFARDGNPYLMYLAWFVPLGFDRFYTGDVSGLTVILWADTGEVCGMDRVIVDSRFAASINEDSVSVADNEQLFSIKPINQSPLPNQTLGLSAVIGMVAFSLGTCKMAESDGGKRRLSKSWAILLCLLMVFSALFFVAPKASATTFTGKSRAYYTPNAGGYHNYGADNAEGNASMEICNYIAALADDHGYDGLSTSAVAWRDDVLASAAYDGRTMLFYVGHEDGGDRIQDNHGNSAYAINASAVMSHTTGEHFFVFIWVCNQAPPLGVTPGTDSMAASWLHKDGSAGHPSFINADGLANPDYNEQCYISFNGFSPMLSTYVNQSGGYYYNFADVGSQGPCFWFIEKFYYYALCEDYSVHDALDIASGEFFGCDYSHTVLNTGYNSWWPGDDESNYWLNYPDPEVRDIVKQLHYSGYYPRDYSYNLTQGATANYMRVLGDSTIKLHQSGITLAANNGLTPAFLFNGEYAGYAGYNIQVAPGTYSVIVTSFPNYRLDNFYYHGTYHSGSSIPLNYDGTLTANYVWDPVYYNLTISSSGPGNTSLSGVQSCLSYTYQNVTAYPDEGYIHYWILDNDYDNPNFSPTIDILMDGPHTLQAYFVERPDYNFPAYVTDSEGTAYDVTNLAGVDNDGQYATLEGWGPYGFYGLITARTYFSAGGHIYAYGYGWDEGPLYTYVSEDGYDWHLVGTVTVPDELEWIDCGIYDAPLNYIRFTAEYPDNVYNVYIDSVRIQPLYYHELSISTVGQGYTSPSGSVQYENGTYVGVTAYPAPAWLFDYWTLDGQYAGTNPSISVYMTQYHSLQAHFVEAQSLEWLTVNAYDAYLSYSYAPAVYVDGYYVGTAPVSLQVAAGREHTLTVDDSVFSEYWYDTVCLCDITGTYNGYYQCGIVYFYPSYSTTIDAWYLPWWW